jgi:hypothetical protein
MFISGSTLNDWQAVAAITVAVLVVMFIHFSLFSAEYTMPLLFIYIKWIFGSNLIVFI